jgi:hypothetical protein
MVLADRNGFILADRLALINPHGLGAIVGDTHGLVVTYGLTFIIEDIDIPVFLAMQKDLFTAGLILEAELVKPATTLGTVALDGALSDLEKIFLFFYKNIFS